MDFTVEHLRPADVSQVVEIHVRAFPRFFLTFLGPRFLREFYQSFLVDPTGVGFVARERQTGAVLGAAVGPLVPQGYFKRLLKRRWWAFMAASLAASLRSPKVIPRLIRAVFYRGDAPPGPPRALLSSIAVAPEAQGHGVGKALVQAWVEEVKLRGADGCFITTDAEGNEQVNRFYQQLGWRVQSTYTTRQGRVMNLYVLDFRDPPSESGQ